MVEVTKVQKVLKKADHLYGLSEIQTAIIRLAEQVTKQYKDKNPLLLCVMNGSLVTMGHLLPELNFPLEIDYIHASRYGEKINGGDINWIHKPKSSLVGREVILVEDIVDHGHTLAFLRKYCEDNHCKSLGCVTLVNKLGIEKHCSTPEFIGLSVPNRYVFGFGMDYKGYWRNLPGIYAISEQDEEGE